MTLEQVSSGQDVLLRYTDNPAIEAVAELIWNSLDAEATEVTVELDTSGSLDDQAVTRVIVTDNGHGFDEARARTEFLAHGDSWKKTLSGRTVTGARVLHGRLGRGRFFAYALGSNVTWTSVTRDDDGEGLRIRVTGSKSSIDKFRIDEPLACDDASGTKVEVRADQGKPLRTLLRDDARQRLTAHMAPHLLGNNDITVRFDGRKLDPASILAREPIDLIVDGIEEADLQNHPAPVLRIIEWNDELRIRPPRALLCNAGGAALFELAKDDLDLPPQRGIRATGYVLWDGFLHDAADLVAVRIKHPAVLDAVSKRFSEWFQQQFDDKRGEIIEQLKEIDAYPYKSEPDSPTRVAERDLFDEVVVAMQPAIGASKQTQSLSARLLHLAITERPESLDQILDEVLKLPDDVRDDLADILRRSSLPAVIRAANVVTRRIDLLTGLRALVYDSDEAKVMREVDQLHPLVRDNEWLFGEQWHLTRSESSLTNVLRTVAPNECVLEEDLVDGRVVRVDGTEGRVDLMLHRDLDTPTGYRRLIVELKRPSDSLNQAHLTQVKSYVQALMDSQSVGAERWEFWLVGPRTHRNLEPDLNQRERRRGHVLTGDNYDLHVVTWQELIDRRLHELTFIRNQLDYDISQDVAIDRLRERHGALIPPGTSSDDDPLSDQRFAGARLRAYRSPKLQSGSAKGDGAERTADARDRDR
jgi:hypothetical protein